MPPCATAWRRDRTPWEQRRAVSEPRRDRAPPVQVSPYGETLRYHDGEDDRGRENRCRGGALHEALSNRARLGAVARCEPRPVAWRLAAVAWLRCVLLATDNSAWIRDLVYLAFPEGEAERRVLFDLVKQFSKMDPEDPEWLRYKLNIFECRAMENMARALNDAATEQARLRGVTREMADFASTQIENRIESAASQTRQLLEDVQLSLHDAIAGEAILKSYTDETRQQFAAVIKLVFLRTPL